MLVLEVGTYKGLVRGEMKIKKASRRRTLAGFLRESKKVTLRDESEGCFGAIPLEKHEERDFSLKDVLLLAGPGGTRETSRRQVSSIGGLNFSLRQIGPTRLQGQGLGDGKMNFDMGNLERDAPVA